MPPKEAVKGRRRSERIQHKEDERKRTNLKELLKRGSSTLEQNKTRAENDGDFSFKRASTNTKPKSNGASTKSKKTAAGKKEAPKKAVRRLQAEDMITPDQQQKKQKRQRTAPREDHSTSIQVSLPEADTPVIRRNKEIRKGGDGRRTSLNSRGKRASSVGNGYTAVPHDQVPINEYYKHLDHSLPDPHKMRQLLTWCAKRVLDGDKEKLAKQKDRLPEDELKALNIAKVIKEEIVRDLTAGKISISWWNREDDQDPTPSQSERKLPNERNVKNAKVLADLKSRLEELKASKAEWEADMSKEIEIPQISLDNVHIENPEQFDKVLDKSLVKEMAEIDKDTYKEVTENLEFTMDTFNQFVHHLKSSSQARQKFAELKSQKLTQILDSTFDDSTLEQIAHNDYNKDIDAQQLLKGISRIDG